MRAEAADRAFLDGQKDFMVLREPPPQNGVERLGEGGIRDRRRQSIGGEFLSGSQTLCQARAETENRERASLAQDASFAEFKRLSEQRNRQADALAARVAEGRRTVI